MLMTDLITFKTNTVSLEGPDLSGKTTLYNNLHRMSGFGWDIRDRSFLSRVCFARQFGRDAEYERQRLEKELCNINNRVIVLLPPMSVLESRILERGDEIQTVESLRSLYGIYEEEVSRIESLPGVFVVRDHTVDVARECYEFLRGFETQEGKNPGRFIRDLLVNHEKNELTVLCNISGEIRSPESSEILQNDLEGHYYREILWDFENTIRKELRGLNPYEKPQDTSSRRFYYSSDTCISSIHLMPRGNHLSCNAVFRSTNAVKNAEIDIEFLVFLTNKIGKKYFLDCKNYTIDLKLNSAHIVEDHK